MCRIMHQPMNETFNNLDVIAQNVKLFRGRLTLNTIDLFLCLNCNNNSVLTIMINN